jgi:hypothetical protein
MASSTFTFGSGDTHIGSKVKAWKAEGGNIYRASFAWWPTDAEGKPDLGDRETGKAPNFAGGPTNFIQGVGYIMNEGAEYTKLAGEPPRQRITTPIILWPTDKKGTLDKDRLGRGDFEVRPWVISGDKYRNLEQIHREFAFSNHDITIKCEEGGAQFQKLTFTPCKENLFRQFLENPKAAAFVKRILDETDAIVANIQEFVGRRMTISQIREKLAGGGGANTPVRDAGDDAVSTADIESITAGLLD